jgi:uncharacterized protein YdeI (YjbR/CyaY-like superfamily)
MSKFEQQLSLVYAKNRPEWRGWLEENHQTSQGTWLVYYKVKTGKPSVKYAEIEIGTLMCWLIIKPLKKQARGNNLCSLIIF